MLIPVKNSHLRVLVLGDIVGRPGRKALERSLRSIRDALQIDLVVANGENAAGGAGIDAGTAHDIKKSGVDLMTLGDHAFQRKGSRELLEAHSSWCVRPFNLPSSTTPGVGVASWSRSDGLTVVVSNLMGRVFMSGVTECPFRGLDAIMGQAQERGAKIVLCDFHAEATSEKWALGRYGDGRVSLLVGTHTHVQTADAQVLPGGTGFITDLGMCGSNTGVIGMDSAVALKRFMSPMPAPYEVAEGEGVLRGVLTDISVETGRCVWIEEFLEDCSGISIGGWPIGDRVSAS